MDELRKTKDGRVAIFDSQTKQFKGWKTSLPTRALAGYMGFMGKEGGYGSNPAGKAMSLVQKPFNAIGEKIAEFGGRQGFPKTGAAVGTGVQMIPDIGMTLGPTASPPINEPGKFTQGLFNQLESASGGMKGSLTEQFKNPATMFSKGRKAASPLYEAAKSEVPFEQTMFKGIGGNKEIVNRAIEATEKGIKLKPQEALIARKALDASKKTFSKDAFSYYRDLFDRAAKESEDIAMADPLHKKGMMAESLRNVMPQNKYGGASAFKMGIAPALAGLGGFVGGPAGAAIGGTAAAATLSPAVQGLGVGALGLANKAAGKINPRIITALLELLRHKNENLNP